jgi:hypothetical protein
VKSVKDNASLCSGCGLKHACPGGRVITGSLSYGSRVFGVLTVSVDPHIAD